MQKEPRAATPKLNNNRRPRNPGTPDNRLRNASSDVTLPNMNRTTDLRQRSTIAPGDIVIPSALFTKQRRANAARLNTTVCQPAVLFPLKTENEYPENELGLLYDKYLQDKATEILVKKKVSDKEQMLAIQMIATSKERDIIRKKFDKARYKENAIKNADIMQNSVDTQSKDVAKCFDDLHKNKVKEKLLKLKALLEPMDELRCPGIVIPGSPEDTRNLFKTLENIGEVLQSVQESISEKGIVYRDLENGLNNFIHKGVEIECVKKKFDEVLCELQVLVLKDASYSLAQNYVDELN